MSRLFTALKEGKVVRRGTFIHEMLLRLDLPYPEYTLVLDQHLEMPEPVADYAEMRRFAYPTAAELGDALFWQSKCDNSKMEAYLASCEAVKLRYPKPE
jgi:hypothetical protein